MQLLWFCLSVGTYTNLEMNPYIWGSKQFSIGVCVVMYWMFKIKTNSIEIIHTFTTGFGSFINEQMQYKPLSFVSISREVVISVRLVEAENLDWRLFQVSDQRLIKSIRRSCRTFELSLHLNWAMPTSLPAWIVYIQHCINPCYHETCISYLCSIENPQKCATG